jgi:hypothetical protein
VGLGSYIAPHTPLPIFPVFTYWHQFEKSPWELEALLPYKFMFRRANTLKGWLSLGTEFNGNSFFNQQELIQLDGDYRYTAAELWTGLTYEYPLNKFILAGFKTGVKHTISTRVVEVNGKPSDYILRGSQNATPYVNLSLSLVIPSGR